MLSRVNSSSLQPVKPDAENWISAAKAAEALIHKDVERIIVTRPVLQADEDLGFLPGDISEKFALLQARL